MSFPASSPRIIFFGTPDFAVASLKALVEHHFNIVAVVTAPDKPAGRGMQLKSSAVKEYALAQQLPVLQPERLKQPGFLAELKSYNADLQVVVAFRMLPEAVWNMPPMGTLNVHGSLLPQYRGAAPVNWAIINGETETGVTTFKLKHEIDTGDILLQRKTAIGKEENVGRLYDRLMYMGAELLVETIKGMVDGTLAETPQSGQANLKHAPKIFKENGLIDWNKPVRAIFNQVRGLSPYPAAYTFLLEKQFKIFSGVILPDNHRSVPGSYETDGKTYLKFAASDGWLLCEDVQMEGKKRMHITDLLRGLRLS